MNFTGIFSNVFQNFIKKQILGMLNEENVHQVLAQFVDAIKGVTDATENTFDDWVVDHGAALLLSEDAIKSITAFLRSFVNGNEVGATHCEEEYTALARDILHVSAADCPDCHHALENKEVGSTVAVVVSLAKLLSVVLPIVIDWLRNSGGGE